jgi:hypothetical protein
MKHTRFSKWQILALIAAMMIGAACSPSTTSVPATEASAGVSQMQGIVDAIDTDSLTVDGLNVAITSQTQIKDSVKVGDSVKLQIVRQDDGTLAAREIEIDDSGATNTNGNTNDNGNVNDNGSDDNGNTNENENTNDNGSDDNGNTNENTNDNDDNGNTNGNVNDNGDDGNTNDNGNDNSGGDNGNTNDNEDQGDNGNDNGSGGGDDHGGGDNDNG